MHLKRTAHVATLLILAGLVGCAQPTPPSASPVPSMPAASATLGPPSKLPGQNSLKAQTITTTAFCDDFDTFDASRWNTYSTPGYWGFYNTSGTYEAANTTVENGALVLRLQHESGDVGSTSNPAVYRSAVVQSIEKMGYGTYESWMRVSNTSRLPTTNGATAGGTFSVFNNYVETDYADAYTKPDTLIESKHGYGTPNDLIYTTYKTNQPETTAPVTTGQNLTQGFHLHRWEWTPDSLRFFVDGVLIHSVTDPSLIPTEAAHLFFNIWPVNKPDWNMPGTSATRYTLVDKFCFTPSSTPSNPSAEFNPVEVNIDAESTPPTVLQGSQVLLSAAGSTGNDLRYAWNFGDGTAANGDPEASGDVTHTYATAGYYTLTLTVTDIPTNTVKSQTRKITVLPTAEQMVKTRVIHNDGPVEFNVGYPTEGISYEWDFGNGVITQGSVVKHAYTTPGLHDITLRVYDDRSPGVHDLIAEETLRVNRVAPLIIPKITLDESYLQGPDGQYDTAYTLDASSGLDANTTYQWEVDGGLTKSGSSIRIYYNEIKTLIERNPALVVKVKTTDQYGRSAKASILLGDAQACCVSRNTNRYYMLHEYSSNGIANTLSSRDLNKQSIKSQSVENGYLGDRVFTPPLLVNKKSVTTHIFKDQWDYDGYIFVGPGVGQLNGHSVTPELINGDTVQHLKLDNSLLVDGLNYLKIQQRTDGPAMTYETYFPVYSDLLVPRITVSVLPDTVVSDGTTSVKLFIAEVMGKRELVAHIVIPESQITADGKIKFDLPVYTLGSDGQIISNLSGKLRAKFLDPRITSKIKGDNVVHGEALMEVSAHLTDFTGVDSRFDFSQVVLYSDDNCGQIVMGGDGSQIGCATTSTVAAAPANMTTIDPAVIDLMGAPSANTLQPQQLTSQAINCSALGKRLNADVLNRIGAGRDSQARKDFEVALRDYESSVVGIVVGIVPFAGDAIDLIAQGYWCATGNQVDYVVVTLAVVGVGLDVFGADVMSYVKALYKSGGPVAQAAIREVVSEIRLGKRSRQQAFDLFVESTGFMRRIGPIDMVEYRTALINSLNLAREGSGSALSALKLYNFSYNKYSDIFGAAYSKSSLIKVAKYAMFAPEIAKSMGKCGVDCIKLTGAVIDNASSSGPKIVHIESLESIFRKISPHISRPLYQIGAASGRLLCSLNVSSLRTLALPKCVADIPKILSHINNPYLNRDGLISGGHTLISLENLVRDNVVASITKLKEKNGFVKYELRGHNGEFMGVKTVFPETYTDIEFTDIAHAIEKAGKRSPVRGKADGWFVSAVEVDGAWRRFEYFMDPNTGRMATVYPETLY